MEYLIIRSLTIFIICLEIMLFFYMFISILPMRGIRNFIDTVLDPVLRPIRFLMKHSIFQSGSSDASPIVAFVVLSYFMQLLESL